MNRRSFIKNLLLGSSIVAIPSGLAYASTQHASPKEDLSDRYKTLEAENDRLTKYSRGLEYYRDRQLIFPDGMSKQEIRRRWINMPEYENDIRRQPTENERNYRGVFFDNIDTSKIRVLSHQTAPCGLTFDDSIKRRYALCADSYLCTKRSVGLKSFNRHKNYSQTYLANNAAKEFNERIELEWDKCKNKDWGLIVSLYTMEFVCVDGYSKQVKLRFGVIKDANDNSGWK